MPDFSAQQFEDPVLVWERILAKHRETLKREGKLNGTTEEARNALERLVAVGGDPSNWHDIANALSPQEIDLGELLATSHQHNCAIQEQHLQQFRGLPNEPIYCWVRGKAPEYSLWNQKSQLVDPLRLVSSTPKPGWAPTGFGMVSGRLSGLMFVDFDSKPERPDQPEETFRGITNGYSTSDLPPTPTRISGKPRRWQKVFRVPAQWQQAIACFSYDNGDLELRWESDEGQPVQSVIGGPHPDSADWFFRWVDGESPADLPIAEAPIWLLQAMLQQKGIELGFREASEEEKESSGGRSAGEPGPCDLLDPKLQRKLIQEWFGNNFMPHRGATTGTRQQSSWKEDSFNGMLSALYHLFGVAMAKEWLEPTGWMDRNTNWGNHPSFESACKSAGTSKTSKGLAGWGLLWHLATRTHDKSGNRLEGDPWKPKSWALPPRDVEIEKTAIRGQKMADAVFAARQEINRLESLTARRSALIRLKEDLNIRSEKEFSQLMRTAAQEQNPTNIPTSVSELMALDLEAKQLVENLLPSGGLTLLAAEGGVGKSSLLYRMAESLTRGKVFADGFKTIKSRVLICQSDENVINTGKKWRRMGFDPDESAIQMWWDFTSSMLPDLEKRVVEEQWDVVMIDSLFKVVSGEGLCMNDPQVADFLYDLNGMAGRTGCAVLLTHHANKPSDRKKTGTRELTRNDVFGTSYFFNATSQCLLLWKAEGELKKLKIEKDRDDSLGEGTVINLIGSQEDYGWHLEGLQGSLMNLDQLQGAEAKVLALLREVDSDGALAHGDICAELNRVRMTSKVADDASLGERVADFNERRKAGTFSSDHVRKVCCKLHDLGKLRRRPLTAGGRGRPSYLYFNKV